jgi:two-component system, OmpR family, sensor histidine kinase KdpD
MNREYRRKTPEELLVELEGEDSPAKGHLKIILGYASGVGKSFRMLDEARRRHERGQDVVIGAVQARVSPDIQSLLDKLEIIPLKQYPSGTAMDIDAILKRRPAVCVIDGLAFNNPPGLRSPTRWRDAKLLVRLGIKVIGSINIQYIEELRGRVEAVTGKHVAETVPASFIMSADEIEIVDAPPEESIERSPEQQLRADTRQKQLSILREMTLVLAADVVDHQLSQYLEKQGIHQNFGTQERILVCITPRANAKDMIETAKGISEKFHGELFVAHVKQADLSMTDKAALEEKLAFARGVGAQIKILEGKNPVDAILELSKLLAITQLFIGHAQCYRSWPWRDPVDRLIRMSRGMDLRIFPQ